MPLLIPRLADCEPDINVLSKGKKIKFYTQLNALLISRFRKVELFTQVKASVSVLILTF